MMPRRLLTGLLSLFAAMFLVPYSARAQLWGGSITSPNPASGPYAPYSWITLMGTTPAGQTYVTMEYGWIRTGDEQFDYSNYHVTNGGSSTASMGSDGVYHWGVSCLAIPYAFADPNNGQYFLILRFWSAPPGVGILMHTTFQQALTQ
jgi:uncharacterized protein YraI